MGWVRNSLAVLVAAAFGAGPVGAVAGTFTFTNDTALVAYSGTSPAQYFAGSNPFVGTTGIGSDFDTVSLSVTMSPLAGGQAILSLAYLSQFSGLETVNGVSAAAADLFLTPAGGTIFGVSLGDQASNGGVAAGFYQVGSFATSEQIWSVRPGYVYGGAIAATTSYQPGQAGFTAVAAPTVITSGRYLGAVAASTANAGNGLYAWDISLVLGASQAAAFSQGFDVFWGTADCANGAFDATVPRFAVAEAGSLPVFSAALAALIMIRHKIRNSGNFAAGTRT
jgi:hypothetical protein